MCSRLCRSGDELDSKIRKAEREIRALENTLAHLLTRNQKYKENFSKKKWPYSSKKEKPTPASGSRSGSRRKTGGPAETLPAEFLLRRGSRRGLCWRGCDIRCLNRRSICRST